MIKRNLLSYTLY